MRLDSFICSTAYVLCLGVALAQSTNSIVHVPLDSRVVFRLPVAIDRLTTVYFPSSISGLEAAFVSRDPDATSRFQYSFLPGNSYFSVRALQVDAIANINVIWRTNVYVLELIQSAAPTYAVEFSAPSHSRNAASAASTLPALTPRMDVSQQGNTSAVRPYQPSMTEAAEARSWRTSRGRREAEQNAAVSSSTPPATQRQASAPNPTQGRVWSTNSLHASSFPNNTDGVRLPQPVYSISTNRDEPGQQSPRIFRSQLIPSRNEMPTPPTLDRSKPAQEPRKPWWRTLFSLRVSFWERNPPDDE